VRRKKHDDADVFNVFDYILISANISIFPYMLHSQSDSDSKSGENKRGFAEMERRSDSVEHSRPKGKFKRHINSIL
jgi:hypothetical protein